MKKSLKQIISFVIVFFMITSMTFGTYSIGEGTGDGGGDSVTQSDEGGNSENTGGNGESSSDSGTETETGTEADSNGDESSDSTTEADPNGGGDSTTDTGEGGSENKDEAGADTGANEGENKDEVGAGTGAGEDENKDENKDPEAPKEDNKDESGAGTGAGEGEEENPIQGPVENPEDQEEIDPDDVLEEDLLEDELLEEELPEELPEESSGKTLIINHIERIENEYEYEERLMESDVFDFTEREDEETSELDIADSAEIRNLIYGEDFVKYFEDLFFLESDPSELFLETGENVINIYYGYEDMADGIGEAPDFLPGEEVDEPLPYIQEFRPGELGPFEEIEKYSLFNLFSTMNTESNTVKNGTTATYPDEVNNKTWPEPGSLKIDKLGGSIADSGNEFEVELKIEGKNRVETSDIVLVMDRSGSMGSGGRMTNAKAAAISFVNTLLNDPNNTSTRIALVSFAGEVTINQQFKGYGGKADLISAINGLNATGGTHIQAGIKQGIAVLNGSTATNKSIVFLGDGGATYSYKPTNPNNYLEFWKRESRRDYYRTTTNIAGFDYGTRVGSGSNEYQQYESGGITWWGTAYSYNYRHGAHAVAEAGFAPADQNIYTIALGAGTEGEWTLQNMANSGYYSTPNPANLTAIYNEIAGSISNAATNAVVTDPLGDMYDILGINGSNYNSLINVSHGNLSYDTATEKITWNIGTISQGEVYTMKYKVALDYSAEGGVFYPANKPTYIEYKNIDDENAKKYFPIPEFRLRELTISKTLSNGIAGDSNKEFFINLAGPGNKTWSVALKSGESKTIKGLLPGNYTIKETVPMNFQVTGGSPATINIGEDDFKKSSNVTNKRRNNGWFWDDPDPTTNSFTIGNPTVGPNRVKGDSPGKNKVLSVRREYFILATNLEEEYKLFKS